MRIQGMSAKDSVTVVLQHSVLHGSNKRLMSKRETLLMPSHIRLYRIVFLEAGNKVVAVLSFPPLYVTLNRVNVRVPANDVVPLESISNRVIQLADVHMPSISIVHRLCLDMQKESSSILNADSHHGRSVVVQRIVKA